MKNIIGRSVKILDKTRKNLTIHTSQKHKKFLENLLIRNNIDFEVKQTDTDYDKYIDRIIKFGLPPFKPTIRKDKIFIFSIPLSYSDKINSLIKLEDVNGQDVYYYKIERYKTKKYKFEGQKNPKFPIYVVSFNRFKNCFYTVSNLEEIKVKYYICIQKSQKKDYQKMLDDNNFIHCLGLVLSKDTNQGGYLQRNKCMEHATKNNFKKCWILDDNISGWDYLNEGNHKITNGWCFSNIEQFIDNIQEPIAIFSHSYNFDIRKNDIYSPYQVNRKNYSSLLLDLQLLKNKNIKFRLKYNEDVDLTLQALNKKLFTLSSNYIVCNKSATLSCKGGNTTSIYAKGKNFDDKLDTLIDTWKNTNIGKFIKKIVKHNDKRDHHFVEYDKITDVLNLSDEITPKKTFKKEKTLKDFGIKIVK